MMTINGEPVAEIDIRASYLTIFLSLRGVQLPTGDPYELPGLGPEHRNAVKAWIVATFGNSRPIVRWPKRMVQKSPELKHYRVSTITNAALTRKGVRNDEKQGDVRITYTGASTSLSLATALPRYGGSIRAKARTKSGNSSGFG
jgi:hypothetical protein